MRRHPKASAVRSTVSGRSRARSGRVGAIRAAFGEVDGSGVPWRRHRGLLVFTLGALAILALVPLAQAKVVVNGFGTTGTLGGQFATPRGVAVNNSGNGGVPAGTVYVVDSQNRVERFSPAGAFERTWGFNVDATAPATGFEICTAASGDTCQAGANGASTANGGQLNNPQGVAVNGANGHVYVTESGGRRISEFDADGLFVRTWGWDVITSGKANDKGTNAFEICDTTAGNTAADCKTPVTAAASGGGGGAFGAAIGNPITDASNNVWVADGTGSRVQEFGPNGNFIKALGADVITDGAEGTGNLTNGSTTVSNLNTTKRFFEIGKTITAASGIQPETTITAVTATSLTLSKAANATVAGQTLAVAEGAGNVPVNEQQTITVGGGATTGSFNLAFNGQETRFTGTGNFTTGSKVITNVITTGTFEVGQGITGSGAAIPAGTTITAVDTVNHTLTVSNPLSETFPNQSITGFSVLRNSTAAALQVKLEALSTIGAGNVSVSGPAGGPWVVTFQGARYSGADVPQLSTTAALSPSGTVTVSSANPGALESCATSAECRTGAPGTAAGQFGSTSPGDLAFDSSANLYAIDTANKRVEQFNPGLTSAGDFAVSTLAAFTNVAPEFLLATQGGTRLDLAVNNSVNAKERQIVELDTAGAVKDTGMVGAGLNAALGGLGVNTTTGNLYATTGATVSPRRVLVLSSTPLPAPVLVNNPITTKTDTTATFSGTVDPTGGLVSCKFEYSTDQVTWTSVAIPGCENLIQGGGAQAVAANVTGLSPGAHYFVRLAVSRPLVANSTILSFVKTFDTDAVAPVITSVGSVDVSDTSARLVATIDPKNSPTAYVFEYGSTPSLGAETNPVAIGSGTTPLVVSQVVSGLEPGTAYYFRVAATNGVATTRSASRAFTTRATPLPSPAGRRFEQVSPPEKGFANVDQAILGQYKFNIGENGNTITYCNAAAGGAQIPTRCGDYVTRRGEDGWHARVLAPLSCGNDLEPHEVTGGGQKTTFVSRELNAAVIGQPEASNCGVEPLSPAAPLPGQNLYRESLWTDSPAYELLTPALSSAVNRSFNTINGSVAGGSRDFSRVVFGSTGNECQPSCAGFTVDGTTRLFEWGSGEARLLSRGVDDAPLTGNSSIGGSPSQEGRASTGFGAVSSDGSHVYFQNPASPELGCTSTNCELYLRKDGTQTVWASEQECSPACSNTAAADAFLTATPAGDKVLFATGAKLVNADSSPAVSSCPGKEGAGFVRSGAGVALGCNLYEFREGPAPASESNNLVDLTIDNEPSDGVQRSLLGIFGMSDDGNTVYFAASGQLVSGEPTESGAKVYRWSWNAGTPTLRYLGSISPGTDAIHDLGAGTTQYPVVNRVDSAGNYLMLESERALDPIVDKDANLDIYRWSGKEGWRCLSCQAPGAPSAGDAEIVLPHENEAGRVQNGDQRPVSSADMERVFFMTPDALVPGDTNGATACPVLSSTLGLVTHVYRCQDVYEWHDGRIGLVSSGTGNTPTYLMGATPDGRDVFFITGDQLVGWDADDLNDIYDARIGGGFPEPAPEGSCDVNAGACEGQGTSAAPGSGAATASFEGPGNQTVKKPVTCRKGFRKVRVKGRVLCKKTHHRKRQRHATGRTR